jgi:GNAT superfamily N-acetyltransferase
MQVRPATPGELRLVRSSWHHQMRPAFRDCVPMGPRLGSKLPQKHAGHEWGRQRYIGQSTASEMFRLLVEKHATTEQVLVAAVPTSQGSEAMGWICRDLTDAPDSPTMCVVHFVYVLRDARRAGLASALLRYVRREASTLGVEATPGAMTGAGLGLWESENSQ